MTEKIYLFILSQKGFEVLVHIIEVYGEKVISGVVIGKDENSLYDYSDLIEESCKKYNIKFAYRGESYEVDTRYAFVIGWKWMIRDSGFIPIIFHDSLLPKYRGFNPLVSALINGDCEVGVTALFAAEQYDKGDIIAQEVVKISYPIKIQDAIKFVSVAYNRLAIKILDLICTKKILEGVKQKESSASYSLWRDDADYKVNWSRDAYYVKRHVDAVGRPYRGAHTKFDDQMLIIHDVEVVVDRDIVNRTPGKVIDIESGCPLVVCGAGIVRITNATLENGDSALPFRKLRVRFV